MSRREEIEIEVGFGKVTKKLKVRIADGDIPPWQIGDEFETVGKSIPRFDAVAKVTGRALYTYDRKMKDMLYGRIVRCPHANADVVSVNLDKALAMRGVHAAIDLTEILRTKSARFAWDGVAAVAAETEELAEQAARAVEVEYDVHDFAVTTKAAMAEGAPQVGRRDQENVLPAGRRWNEPQEEFDQRLEDARIETEEALARSDIVIEGEYETQVQNHNPLETHGVLCAWENDELICYASTQGTFSVQQEATSNRGVVRARNARVMTEYMGGGFGAKFGLGKEGVAGAFLAKEAKRPVHLMLDRREEAICAGNRPDSIQKLTLGMDGKGRITALRSLTWGTAGAGPGGAGARNTAIYDFPKVDKREWAVRTNNGNARAFRAPGYPQGVFALEQLMDVAAAKIGMDPIEFRKLNDTHPIRIHEYDMGAERIGWKKNRNRKPGSQKGPIKTGVGCASTMWFNAGGGRGAAEIRIHKNGQVEVRSGVQDIGTGTRTIMGMVAAEELGIDVERIQTFVGDTNDPLGPGSGGSTTIGTMTPAVRLAAHRAKRKLLELVAEEHEWKVDDLDMKGEKVVLANGGKARKSVSFSQACGMMTTDRVTATADRPVLDRRRANYEGFAETNAGVQFAEVEVDTETGNVRVKKIVAVQDSGKIINPMTAESQVRGGVIGGVGYALYERRVMDRVQGRMLNADLESYKVVGSMEVPEIDVVLLDVFNGKNNTSTMGLGEPPKVATAAAIANAVANAIGVRIHTLPITPRTVLEALAAKEKKK